MLFEREGGSIKLGASLNRRGVSTNIDEMMPYLSYLAINHDFEAIEEAFGIEIPEDAAEKIRTVGEAAEAIRKATGEVDG